MRWRRPCYLLSMLRSPSMAAMCYDIQIASYVPTEQAAAMETVNATLRLDGLMLVE